MILNRNKTLIILDWDDTLFPTTWVTTNDIDVKNLQDTSPTTVKYFAMVDTEVFESRTTFTSLAADPLFVVISITPFAALEP